MASGRAAGVPSRRMHKCLALLATIGAVIAAPAATAPIAIAKSCSSGYRHANVNGGHKCLRRGQFCARSSDRSYHRYGYHCHSRGRLS